VREGALGAALAGVHVREVAAEAPLVHGLGEGPLRVGGRFGLGTASCAPLVLAGELGLERVLGRDLVGRAGKRRLPGRLERGGGAVLEEGGRQLLPARRLPGCVGESLRGGSGAGGGGEGLVL
jgi:hypothetical protein